MNKIYYRDPSVRCAYYQSEDKHRVRCHGDEFSNNHRVFGDSNKKKLFKAKWCRGDWEHCPYQTGRE